MQDATNLFTRDDTFFGVCEALGQDLGFDPIYLRITLAVFLLVSPVTVLAVYAGAGILVVASRFAFPNRARRAPERSATIVRPEFAANQGESQAAMALAA